MRKKNKMISGILAHSRYVQRSAGDDFEFNQNHCEAQGDSVHGSLLCSRATHRK